MSEDSLRNDLSLFGTTEEVDPELLAEYQRELERHEAAQRMVRLKEQEALEAKRRAAESQQTVEEMTHRYLNVKQRLDVSKQTLEDARLRSECRERVCNTINGLRLRAEELLKKHQLQIESRDDNRSKLITLTSMSENARAFANQQENQKPMVDLSQTVLNLQEKLAKNSSSQQPQQLPQPQQPQQLPQPQQQQTLEKDSTQISVSVDQQQSAAAADANTDVGNDAGEPEVDINAMVQRIEAKCANVREELGRMAVSEQYMRTKQAQLVAKRKEKEMMEAERKAAVKENEAQEMRRKVEELTQLLAARKAKLKATENTLQRKTVVVEKVEKILTSKERKANYIEKQKVDQVMFGKTPKK